jgi:hypothetical protein
MKQTERGPIYGPRARSLGGTGDCSSPAAAAPAEQLPSSRPHMPAVRLIPKAIPKGYTQRGYAYGGGGLTVADVAVVLLLVVVDAVLAFPFVVGMFVRAVRSPYTTLANARGARLAVSVP